MDEWNEPIEDNEDLSALEDAGDDLYEHFRFVADKGQNLLRVDKFLVDRITGASRNRIQQAAEAGCVLSNGNRIKSNYKVKPLDVITIVMDRPRRELIIIPEDIPLCVVYEDDDLMVVDKPPGRVVHPGYGNYTGTLVNAIAWHLQRGGSPFPSEGNVEDPRLGLVHRIDKDTSGLLVIAKNPDAKTRLGLQFYHKTTRRLYAALVWGNVRDDEGIIEGNLARHLYDRMQMAVFPDNYGKPAVTHYRVLERFGYVTLVECRLETGRTHQIRVHMKHIGHPVFNDERYGGNVILKGENHAKYRQFVQNCFAVCPRQALHARTLGFVHPRTGEELFFESPVPEDMQQLITKWKKMEI
jgi:23S rRNA pseudouridine1911/1915/1917 synthase